MAGFGGYGKVEGILGGSFPSCPPPNCTAEPGIIEGLEVLNKLLDEHEQSIASLGGAIDRVLLPPVPQPCSNEVAGSGPSYSEVCNRVRSLQQRVIQQTGYLQDYQRRVNL